MAIVEQKWSALPVPFAIETPDRVPKERYYDPGFYRMEGELLWPRVWQMACRLEEIPKPGDFAEYEILDQSVLVVRTEDMGVRAFDNACRHRGVRFAQGRGSKPGGFVCPFHGWCYGTDGQNTRVTQSASFSEHNREPPDLNLVPVRCEAWGGCAWINLDRDAPPLRECMEPFATVLDAWKVESLRAEWWYSARLPINWKLGVEAFVEQYHVLQSHPQLRIPGRYPGRDAFDPSSFLESELLYLRTMSEGMAGMVHARDLRIAEKMADLELPGDHKAARSTWDRSLNDAVVQAQRARGCDMPDLNELAEQGIDDTMWYCFPHFFVLPMYSSATSYRFRPLGPEETLMDMWSLTRYPAGEEPEAPAVPEPWPHDDPRWPPIPTQDFSNLPKQQRGLHARSFEYMRLSEQGEGHISNYQRIIDGFLAGLPTEQLLPELRKVNLNPLEQPIVEIKI
ncbi:MAG TPA: aromatic ring-hydroxylating dioxygenase subunit alpha [Acidimicrobiales bacterium]|jgi:phenylpropionate dioxygenase-like ring-hydroxylating dioxygenase large terminal subunit|nr:aromatic ring-hydroxylating dioxygenase subunit alpha [Acidimicrobiales bacterium]